MAQKRRNQEIAGAVGQSEFIPADGVLLTRMPDGTTAVNLVDLGGASNPRRRSANRKAKVNRRPKRNAKKHRLPKRNAKGRFIKKKNLRIRFGKKKKAQKRRK